MKIFKCINFKHNMMICLAKYMVQVQRINPFFESVKTFKSRVGVVTELTLSRKRSMDM